MAETMTVTTTIDWGGGIDALTHGRTSTIARDLKLNLKRLLCESHLAPEEAAYTALATATSLEYEPLIRLAKEKLGELGKTADEIREAAESAAMMAMLNTYYRFKHMIDMPEVYTPASLRMTALARPVLGKRQFEMLAFAVSVLGGCESCIRSHEAVLKEQGVSTDKIHDLARIAAVVSGLRTLHTTANDQPQHR